jgi:hypothetical protein
MRDIPGHVNIGTFADHNLAAIVRSRLEDAGISVVIPYEHTSALRIPFVSGKLNLFVREEDENAAWAVLQGEADEIENADWEGQPGPAAEGSYLCPHCSSDALRLLPAPLWPTFLSIVLPGYSLDRIPSRWHCLHCDQVWEE